MADQLIREVVPFQSTPLCPVPQYWAGSSYEKVQGTAGAMYVAISGGVTITGSTVAATISDGADVALGAKADAAVSTAGTGSVIALLKGMQTIMGSVTSSPTANTVGDRLKTIATNTGTASSAATSILASIGATSDAAATGEGSLIAIVKQLRTILTDVWDDADNALTVQGDVGLVAGTEVEISATPVVGAHGNAWNAASVLADGESTAIDCQYQHRISAFGSVDAATTVSVLVSQDNTNFFDTGSSSVLGGAGDFHLSLETAARYVRLKSSGTATITATIAGK